MQAVVLQQLVRMARLAIPLEVFGRRHHNTAQLANLPCDKRGVFQFADTYADIKPFGDQIDHAVELMDFDVHARVALGKARDGSADMQLTEQHRCRHHQSSLRLAVFGA